MSDKHCEELSQDYDRLRRVAEVVQQLAEHANVESSTPNMRIAALDTISCYLEDALSSVKLRSDEIPF